MAFNPWDGSFRLYPLPPNARDNADMALFGQTRGSLRIMTRHYLVREVGPAYTIYMLENGEWLRERVIHLRRLVAKSNWLSRYAPKRDSHGSGCLAFHPENADMVYLRCKDYVVQVNMRSAEWRVIDVVHKSKVYHHHPVPLMLPCWPTPFPILPRARTAVEQNKYQIHTSLPLKIDPSVTMMTVEEKPDVTYDDVGGCKEQIEKMRGFVELPMLHPENFVKLGIDPPKGVLCYGPPGTGKTLVARAVASRTDACFIRIIGSELVQKYVGEGAQMVHALFQLQMARSKKACIVFFDELDAIGGACFDDGAGGDNEVHRTMLEIVNRLDGLDACGNVKVLMATNRPDTLDPALLCPGRLDGKVGFGLPDVESRTQIFKIHTRELNCEGGIRYELLARLCPNSTGADIRSVCMEAGMYAVRCAWKQECTLSEQRGRLTEKDFMDAMNKVMKGYRKYMIYK